MTRRMTDLLADNNEVDVAPKNVLMKPPGGLGLQLMIYFEGVVELDLHEGGWKTVLC